jgi:hypothetical protein
VVAKVAVQLPKVKGTEARTLVLSTPESYMYELIRDYQKVLKLKWTVDAGLTEWTIGILTCVGFKRELWMKTFTNGLPLFKVQNKSIFRKLVNRISKHLYMC